MSVSRELFAKLQLQIDALEAAVNRFDYSQLRAVKRNQELEGDFYGATDDAVSQLFLMFAGTFLCSPNKELRGAFNNLDQWPEAEAARVLQLANVLLRFKNNIQQAENKYFEGKQDGELLANLRTDANWLQYFHYTIEQYLQKDLPRYGAMIENIQGLGKRVCWWVGTHRPHEAALYSTFQSSALKNRLPVARKQPLLSLLPASESDEETEQSLLDTSSASAAAMSTETSTKKRSRDTSRDMVFPPGRSSYEPAFSSDNSFASNSTNPSQFSKGKGEWDSSSDEDSSLGNEGQRCAMPQSISIPACPAFNARQGNLSLGSIFHQSRNRDSAGQCGAASLPSLEKKQKLS